MIGEKYSEQRIYLIYKFNKNSTVRVREKVIEDKMIAVFCLTFNFIRENKLNGKGGIIMEKQEIEEGNNNTVIRFHNKM